MSDPDTYHAKPALQTEALVLEHAPLVKRIAYHLIGRLPPHVDVEDLIQAGMIGLLEAAKNFSTEGGANFATFAGIRIRGAMLDEVRRLDWTPRSVHRKLREVSRVVSEIENRSGRDARDREIIEALGISSNEYYALLQDAATSRLCSLDELVGDEQAIPRPETCEDHGPLEELQRISLIRALADEITRLPERERLVMSLYYDDELNLREIGEVLGVTESRVCQIHGQALVRLRSRLVEWTDEGRERPASRRKSAPAAGR